MNQIKETVANIEQNGKVYLLVIEHIKTLIQSGEISFGGKLPSERQLMMTLNLSRNSIREALRSLENMGIIESRHGQGNFLVNHMGKSLGSIFSLQLFMNQCSDIEISQLRRSIEIGAYLLAVKQAQETEILALAHSLDQMECASVEERTKQDKNFHDTLIKISGNRLFQLLNETLSQLFESTIQQLHADVSPEEWQTLLSYHAHIYQFLVERDETAGTEAIIKHYDFIDQALRQTDQADCHKR
ncbi:MAG: FadR family transcriptional regulator [Lachnospiraceae bacterium]|jgi:Transcriptional regulators|nr:FadR family transcriptional regulator [Lachnospiraceae bacterium]